MQGEISNIISIPSQISDNNHQLILQDLIYINHKSYSLNLLSTRPSLYFQIQDTPNSLTISPRHQSPNQLLSLLSLYILLTLESQKQCIEFIKRVTYSQNIIQLVNPPLPKYYKDRDIVLATRTYLSKIIDEFSKLSLEERMMLEPNEHVILSVWVVVFRNILYRSLKDQSLINYNTVITKSNIDKLAKIIKIKPSGFIRLIVDRKGVSMIVIDRVESPVSTERRLMAKELKEQVGANRNEQEQNKSGKSAKWGCCCVLI